MQSKFPTYVRGLLLSFLLCTQVQAADMPPLSQYPMGTIAGATQVTLRCAALFSVTANLSKDNPKQQKFLRLSKDHFVNLSVHFLGKTSRDTAPVHRAKALSTVSQFTPDYEKLTNQAFSAHGTYFPKGGFLAGDMKVCAGVLKAK